MYQCPVCEYSNDKLISLSIHYRKIHKHTSKQLYVDLFCNGVEPTCACGCKEFLKFHSIETGFSKFNHGHQSRINNNWGQNKEGLKKSQEVRRQQIINGDWKPWNKDLTKESDNRVALYGMKGSLSISSNIEEIKRRSERLSKNRLNGIVRTLRGKEHSQWKGGVSALQAICRSYVYRKWSYPKMKASNFICNDCQATEQLEVHHDKERFADILQKAISVLGEPGEDFEKKIKFAEWVTDYHLQNDVSGIVVCQTCHELRHK